MNPNPNNCRKCGRFMDKRGHKCGFQKGGYRFKKTTSKAVSVAQQPHYTQFKIQPITFIEANKLSYSQGNVVKYVCRYKGKDGLKDLQKAKVYIDYLIQDLQTGTVKP